MTSVAYIAVWLFVFAIPWENTLVIPGLGTISKLLGIIAVSLALLAAVVSGRLRRWQTLHIAAALFVLWSTAMMLDSSLETLPRKFVTYVQLLGVLLMMWELAPTRRRQLGLLAAFVLGAEVAAASTVVVFRNQADVARRFAAQGFDPNDLAMTLALAMPMAWYLGMTYQSALARWVCRAYLPLGLFALGLTGSRGGMLAAMTGLMVVPFTMTRLSPGRLVMAIAFLGLSTTLAIAYVPRTALERLASTGTEMQEGSYGGRFKIWGAGVQAFTAQPIVGHGVGSYPIVVAPILGPGHPHASHNSMLTILVEQGLVGFAMYATMFGSVALAVLRLPLVDRRFGLILLAATIIAMLPLGWEDSKSVWFVLAALLGLARAPLGARAPAPTPGRAVPVGTPMGANRPGPMVATPRGVARRGTAR
jgi:O-antigen ligase